MLRNTQKKLDNLKDEVEAKDNEGGDIFLLLKKGFEHSDDKMGYKKAIINEILSLEEIDNDKINNDNTSKEIDNFASSIIEQIQHLKRN